MRLSVLTPSERLEAVQRIFLIKGKLKGQKGKGHGDDRFYVRLETALSVNLKANWRDEYTKALTDIFAVFPEKLTTEAIEILEKGLLDALGPAFGLSPVVRKEVRKKIERAYAVGKQESARKIRQKPIKSLSLPDRRAIDTLTRHNCFWLGQHYGKHIGSKISELGRQALEDGLGRNALAKMLKKAFNGDNDESFSGYRYWDVASSAALVRARSFGTIAGMEDAGITEYEILAMGDERMCPICGEMNGRVFSVAETRAVIDSVLNIDDPGKFKDAMPWHSSPPVGISGLKLAQSGQSLPPFHGRCRCTVIVKSKMEPVTRESFSPLKAENIKSYDPDTRIARIKGSRQLPGKGLPNWKYDLVSVDHDIKTRRFFDADGIPVLDVDLSDHGNARSHPYVPHSHDWRKGVRNKEFRKPRKWEKEMGDVLRKQIIKDSAGEDFTLLSETSRNGTLEGFVHDLEIGVEIEFKYDGRLYTATNYNPPQAWEWRKEETWKKFKDIPDMLDNFILHTGERLREVVTRIEIIFSGAGY